MRVADVQVTSRPEWCELRARIESDGDATFEPFELWYRFPAWREPFLQPANGDPFLAALLVPAMTLGERLEIPGAVSPALLRALPEIQSILHCFDPRQGRIEVVAQARERPQATPSTTPGVGLFFSLGIDSFYSLLKNQRDHPGDEETISHLIFVHGMDFLNGNGDEDVPAALLEHGQRVAQETGTTLVPVATNIRAVLDPLALWTMAHGAALASIALALGGCFRRVSIAASTTYDQLYPWGSHPVLDPRWATERVAFVHDGCELDRIGKTQIVAASQTALDTLRVCSGYTTDYNCGRCVKCLPTMIDLLQLGVLHRCRTLPHTVDAEQLGRILVAYRGHLNVGSFRRRHDAFTDDTHRALRAVLGDFLAGEESPPPSLMRPVAGAPVPRGARLTRWLRRRRGAVA
jgi:hypothetical protein